MRTRPTVGLKYGNIITNRGLSWRERGVAKTKYEATFMPKHFTVNLLTTAYFLRPRFKIKFQTMTYKFRLHIPSSSNFSFPHAVLSLFKCSMKRLPIVHSVCSENKMLITNKICHLTTLILLGRAYDNPYHCATRHRHNGRIILKRILDIRCENAAWSQLALDRPWRRAVVYTVIKIQAPCKAENFLTEWVAIRFSSTTVLWT